MTPARSGRVASGHRVEIERADVAADDLVVDRHARQMTQGSGQSPMTCFRLDGFIADLDLPAGVALADEGAMPLRKVTLFFLNRPDAAGELVDHARLAGDHQASSILGLPT